MNTYYKLTPIAEAPKENGFYWSHAEDYERPGISEYRDGVWLKGFGVFRGSADTQITHYLSPVPAVGAVWIDVNDDLPAKDGYYFVWSTQFKPEGEPGLVHWSNATGWQNGFYKPSHWAVIPHPSYTASSACDRIGELEAKNNALRDLTRKVYARGSEREEDLRKEVERLKAVIAYAHSFGWVDALLNNELSEEESFQNFKTEHNL